MEKQGPTQTRKIKPTRRSVSGIYAFRGKTAIAYESTLERDFIIRKEFDLRVQKIIPQPIQIPFVLPSGRAYTYTPDFLVYFQSANERGGICTKPVLIEVKEESEWRENWRSWLPKWKAAYRYARQEGWTFKIQDESRIRDDDAFKNIKFLEIYQRMHFPAEELQKTLERVRLMGSVTCQDVLPAQVKDELSNRHAKSLVWHLLATRRLDCDISQPLNDQTTLWESING